MLRLSPDVISATFLLIDWIKNRRVKSSEDIAYAPDIYHLHADDIYEVGTQCGVFSETDNSIGLGRNAMEIISNLQNGNNQAAYRRLLYYYISCVHPAWAGRIPYGRMEAVPFMSKDEQACLYEAGLLEPVPNNESIKWWDEVSTVIRQLHEQKNNEVGRKGEILTIEYETNRVGKTATWVSIDTNCAGYDIRSHVSSADHRNLLIEVKTSSLSLNSAWFHVTSNEWTTASTSDNYIFYLWIINNNNISLAKVQPSELEVFLQKNRNGGEWESAKIPFMSFSDKFLVIKEEL